MLSAALKADENSIVHADPLKQEKIFGFSCCTMRMRKENGGGSGAMMRAQIEIFSTDLRASLFPAPWKHAGDSGKARTSLRAEHQFANIF